MPFSLGGDLSRARKCWGRTLKVSWRRMAGASIANLSGAHLRRRCREMILQCRAGVSPRHARASLRSPQNRRLANHRLRERKALFTFLPYAAGIHPANDLIWITDPPSLISFAHVSTDVRKVFKEGKGRLEITRFSRTQTGLVDPSSEADHRCSEVPFSVVTEAINRSQLLNQVC